MNSFTRSFRYFFLIALGVAGLSALPARAWWNPDYTLRKKITIDTTAAGGGIQDPIGTTPVLIRLSGDFNFSAAKDDGSDLRLIAGDDKTPLAFHIEKFDSLLGEAFIWVQVPDVKPGAITTFWLYYGDNQPDKAAPGAADAKKTYDSDTVLVYHFAEAGKAPHDYSGNNNDADNVALTTDGSYIGFGARFDGKTPVTVKPSDSLNWGDGAALTWSAWIKVITPQANAALFSRRNGPKDFVVGVDNLTPFIDINGQHIAASGALTVGTWKHLAIVSDGAKETICVNGVAMATAASPMPALAAPVTLGADTGGTGTAFVGEMDELELSKTARPVGFIKLAALEQGGDAAAKLLVVGQDEQPAAGWLSGALGLFGVILKSVTIDGWVIIGFLAVLGCVSWYVMITKFFYLNAVEKGNAEFLKQWSEVSTDLTGLDHSDAESMKSLGGRIGGKLARLMRMSPLFHVYHIGSNEIRQRISDPRYGRVLSAQSIQAIRAALDGGYVRQGQAINGGLVFLTISIAGGPFIGLLGTVAGVMITFASIAATGEVNINAIAPGISAALVATLAGLVVAIPALLGYNYLTSRIRNVTADLQIFIDEFVTKMAEFYRPGAEPATELEVSH
jgi:biopolymer transport protein ExbB